MESNPLPFFFVGKQVTDERKMNFITNKYPLLNNQLGREDTRSIWYTKEHIVKLLEEIEFAQGDGIRLYFSAYEQSHEFAGQLCLVMNVTRERNINGSISHVNVVLEDEPEFQERSTYERSISVNSIGTKKDYNFGSPCPPRCAE